MEPAVIAAVVAGLVSLAAVLANLRIARQARDASRQQIALAAAIKSAETGLQAVRGLARKTERLRIACWHLRSLLVGRELLHGSGPENDEFWDACAEVERAYREFFDEWADAKFEVPPSLLEVIRQIRHEARAAANDLFNHLATLRSSHSKGRRRQAESTALKDLDHRVSALQAHLESLFAYLVSTKNDMLTDVILGGAPDPQPTVGPPSRVQRLARRLARNRRG